MEGRSFNSSSLETRQTPKEEVKTSTPASQQRLARGGCRTCATKCYRGRQGPATSSPWAWTTSATCPSPRTALFLNAQTLTVAGITRTSKANRGPASNPCQGELWIRGRATRVRSVPPGQGEEPPVFQGPQNKPSRRRWAASGSCHRPGADITSQGCVQTALSRGKATREQPPQHEIPEKKALIMFKFSKRLIITKVEITQGSDKTV